MTAPTAIAKFTGGGQSLLVHFNPASLKISLTNQIGDSPPQQTTKPTATKLDVELIFDTTQTGADVRETTKALRLMATATATEATQKPAKGKGGGKPEVEHSLQKITFSWGTAKYYGIIESLNETLDFWSSDGVPLRSTIQIGMKGAGDEFFSGTFKGASYSKTNPAPPLNDFVPVPALPASTGATGAAAAGGDPGAGRMLAALNGVENMRLPGGGALSASASGSVNLSAAAGFKMSGGVSAGASIGFGMGASAGASIGAGLSAGVGVGMSAGAGIGMGASAGLGAGAGIGMSAGAGAGMSGGIGMSAGAGIGMSTGAGIGASAGAGFAASAGAGIVSGSATAGISASQGAFAGLGASKMTLPGPSFKPGQMASAAMPSVGAGAHFDATGKLVSGGGQVAASYSTHAGVTFF
jgi:hypothetical protein